MEENKYFKAPPFDNHMHTPASLLVKQQRGSANNCQKGEIFLLVDISTDSPRLCQPLLINTRHDLNS